jgi:hypothetical protein
VSIQGERSETLGFSHFVDFPNDNRCTELDTLCPVDPGEQIENKDAYVCVASEFFRTWFQNRPVTNRDESVLALLLARTSCHELGHMFGLVSGTQLFGSPPEFSQLIDDQLHPDTGGRHNVLRRASWSAVEHLMDPFRHDPLKDPEAGVYLLPNPPVGPIRPVSHRYLEKLGLQ